MRTSIKQIVTQVVQAAFKCRAVAQQHLHNHTTTRRFHTHCHTAFGWCLHKTNCKNHQRWFSETAYNVL